MIMNPEWVGGTAALLTTGAYIPQVAKVLRTRDTASLSLGMYTLITTGLFIWMLYGLMIGSMSLIIANGIAFVLAGLVLFMKLRYG